MAVLEAADSQNRSGAPMIQTGIFGRADFVQCVDLQPLGRAVHERPRERKGIYRTLAG